MNMIFTAKKSPFSKTPEQVPIKTTMKAPIQAPVQQEPESQEQPRSLESYSKYQDIASKPDTFSDRITVFSGKNMLSRIGTSTSGCSSCGLRMKSNKPLKKDNIY